MNEFIMHGLYSQSGNAFLPRQDLHPKDEGAFADGGPG